MVDKRSSTAVAAAGASAAPPARDVQFSVLLPTAAPFKCSASVGHEQDLDIFVIKGHYGFSLFLPCMSGSCQNKINFCVVHDK